MNCGPLSEMIRGLASGNCFFGPLDDDFHISFQHPLTDLPVNDIAAAPVEKAAEIVERATDVEIRDIHVPMLVGPKGLNKARSLFADFLIPPIQIGQLWTKCAMCWRDLRQRYSGRAS